MRVRQFFTVQVAGDLYEGPPPDPLDPGVS